MQYMVKMVNTTGENKSSKKKERKGYSMYTAKMMQVRIANISHYEIII